LFPTANQSRSIYQRKGKTTMPKTPANGGSTNIGMMLLFCTTLDGDIIFCDSGAQAIFNDTMIGKSIYDIFTWLEPGIIDGLAPGQSFHWEEPVQDQTVSMMMVKDSDKGSLYVVGFAGNGGTEELAAGGNNAEVPAETGGEQEKETHVREYVAGLLQQTIDRHMAMFNTLPAIMYLKDSQGRYIEINEAFCRHVRNRKEEIIGKTDCEIFPGEIAEKYMAGDRRLLDGDCELIRQEERYAGEDGQERWYYTVKVPQHGARGWIDGVVGMTQDITDRHERREHLMRLERLAETRMECIAGEIGTAMGKVNTALSLTKRRLETFCSYSAVQGHQHARPEEFMKNIIDDIGKGITDAIDGTAQVMKIVNDIEDSSSVKQTGKEQADHSAGQENVASGIPTGVK